MSFFAKNKEESRLRTIAGYIGAFLLSAAVFTFIQYEPSFRDPDTFYHMKIAMLMMKEGIVYDFPWLPFTTLATAYTDHHFLYHLALIPFFQLFGPLIGMKVAAVAFAAAAVTAFYGLLRSHKVRFAFWFAILLATSSGFIFRLNLAKATALSLTLIMLTLIALRKNRIWLVFILSWLYVLLHAGWPIMIVIVGVTLGTKAVIDRIADRHPLHSWASLWFWRRLFRGSRNAWRDFLAATETRQAAAALGGIAAGLVINPYFPANFLFYWEQIWQIAVVGYKDKIGVGSEWYPYPFLELFGAGSMVFLLFALGLVLLTAGLLWKDVYRGTGKVKRSEIAALVSSFFLAALFFAMTLRSRRHIEYFVPFAMLFDAVFLHLLLSHIDARKVLAKVSSVFKKPLVFQAIIVGYFAFVMPFMSVRDVLSIHDSFLHGIPFTKYEKASVWLQAHAKPGAVVVHSDWDDFPPLFFRNDQNSYMCGLDPTFFYRQDPTRYWQWVNLTTGRTTTGIGALMKTSFGAKFALIEKDHVYMKNAMSGDPSVFLVYEDDEVWIYATL